MPTNESVDFYSLLGIEVESDEKTIRKAFRKAALKYHPDKTKGDPRLTELYKQVCEAKEVLMDEQKRAVYNKKYKAMLASKSRRENMDKRQREMTESLFAREEAAKRRRNGELTEEERRLQRIRQVKMEDRRTIDHMLQEQRSGIGPRGHTLDYFRNLERVCLFISCNC